MSPAVESAVAPPPLDVGALKRKLIELRTEIDAILAQVASLTPPATESVPPAAETPAQEASAVHAPAETVLAEAATHDEKRAGLGREAASEAPECDLDAVEQTDAADETKSVEASLELAPAIEKPAATLTGALAACEVVTGDETAVAASIDAEVTSRGPASPATEDVIPSDATAAGPSADAEPKSDALVPAADASVSPAPATEVATAAEEPAQVAAAIAATAIVAPEPPAAAAEATAPARETPAAPAATVINLEPRQRKEKADLAPPRPVAAPRAGRMMRRIAAGIVALIAAASALVLADREAIGGSHTFPWVSPLPSYQMPWSFFGQQKRAEGASVTGVSAVGSAAAGQALLARYRDIWPVSP